MNAEIDRLLARYFSGEASAEEQIQLEDWLGADPANELYFDQLTTLYEQVTVPQQAVRKPDTDKALYSFMQHVQRTETKVMSSPETEGSGATKSIFGIVRNHWPAFAAAASLLVLITLSVVRYASNLDSVRLASFETELEHVLPDSTRVLLSGNSQIEYDKNYGKTHRTLCLRGEAFVQVGSAGQGKFLLKVGETIIEDVGTSFKVTAWPAKDDITVVVEEGQVLFYTNNDKGIDIDAGQVGVFHKLTRTFGSPTDKETQLLPSRHLIFDATPLLQVADELSKSYKVKILLDKGIENKTITVEFDNLDLDLVIEVIVQTLQLDVHKEGDNYRLSRKGD